VGEQGRPEELLSTGESLWLSDAFDEALEKLDAARKIGEETQRPAIVVRALNLIGNVHDSRFEIEAARSRHEAALRLARSIGDDALEGSVLADIGLGHWRRADYISALHFCERALRLQRAAGDRRGEAATLGYEGRVHLKKGEYDDAAALHRRALAIQEEIGDPAGQAQTLEDLGDVELDRRAYAKALDLYHQALRIREKTGDAPKQVWLLAMIGTCYAFEGASVTAEASYRRGLEIADWGADSGGRAMMRRKLAESAAALDRPADALELMDEVLAYRLKTGDRRTEAWDHALVARAQAALGRPREALQSWERATAIWEETGDRRGLAYHLYEIGRLHARLGDGDRAMRTYERALREQRSIDLPYQNLVLTAMGLLEAERGRKAAAVDLGRRAVAFAEKTGNPEMKSSAWLGLGRIHLRNGSKVEALAGFRKSIAIVEDARLELAREDSPKIGFLENKQEVYQEAVRLLMDLGRFEEALETAERGRARAFLDLLGTREKAAKPADATTLARIRALGDALREGAREARAPGTGRRAAASRGGHALDAAIARVRSEDPELASFVSVSAPSLGDLSAAAMRRGATILEYFASDQAVFIWVVGSDGKTHAATSGVGMTELELLVERSRAADDAGRRALRDLHRILVEPVARWLPSDPERLVIVIPHGPLFLVSFAGLLDGEGRYLAERHTLSYAPAIGVLAYTAAKRDRVVHESGRRVLAVGNPAMPRIPGRGDPLAPLPEAEEEVAAIRALYPVGSVTVLTGGRATESSVRVLAPAQTVLHLATHGIVRGDSPMESLLALAPDGEEGAGGDGLWTVREVFATDLHADLVVLSACDTGLGKIGGDGVIGLSRAFIYAGAASVVVSLWRVEDVAGRFLMGRFYRTLLANGGNKAAALRQAQLATLEELRVGRLRSGNGEVLVESPLLWAPFVLIGEAR
jgi:CHAT domain-containing protein/tetratricopeptide (TPR) repeat protein